jgi:hypothetical protein
VSLCKVDKNVIQDLLEKTIFKENFHGKTEIKYRRPFPPLSNLKSIHKDKKDTYAGNFEFAIIGKHCFAGHACCFQKVKMFGVLVPLTTSITYFAKRKNVYIL